MWILMHGCWPRYRPASVLGGHRRARTMRTGSEEGPGVRRRDMACGRAHLQRWPAPSSRSAEDCRKAASPSYYGAVENTENRNRQLSYRNATTCGTTFPPSKKVLWNLQELLPCDKRKRNEGVRGAICVHTLDLLPHLAHHHFNTMSGADPRTLIALARVAAYSFRARLWFLI